MLEQDYKNLAIDFYIPHDRPFPRFEKPVPIGCFSIGDTRQYINNAENMQYFHKPRDNQLPLDLNKGFENVIKKNINWVTEDLSHLLHFICMNFDHADLNKQVTEQRFLNDQFICYRGLLTLLGETPFQKFVHWTITVTRYKGNYYMCRFLSPEEKEQRRHLNEMEKRMESWGYKFEQYCSSNSPDTPPDSTKPVNENTEFGCVFRSKLGEYSLLYGAEMDCISNTTQIDANNRKKLEHIKFLELKTRERWLYGKKEYSYRNFKALKWWLQSFLVGIETIIVGLRNSSGMVEAVEEMQVNSLRKLGNQLWSSNKCFAFIVDFLNAVADVMQNEDDPYTTFVFKCNPADRIVSYTKREGLSDYSFLSDFYIHFVEGKYKEIMANRSIEATTTAAANCVQQTHQSLQQQGNNNRQSAPLTSVSQPPPLLPQSSILQPQGHIFNAAINPINQQLIMDPSINQGQLQPTVLFANQAMNPTFQQPAPLIFLATTNPQQQPIFIQQPPQPMNIISQNQLHNSNQ